MKKAAILAIALAMPAMAGTPAVVTVPVPEPAPVAAACPCSIEVAGFYRYTSRDFTSVNKAIDTYGVDLTAVHTLNENHAITLRAGYAYGSEVFREDGEAERNQLENFSIMPGYRYTCPVGDKLSVFAGVNAGIVWSTATYRIQDGLGSEIGKDHEWGFAASGEVGVSYKVCDHTSVFAAYELSGNDVKFYDKKTHRPVYHGVRVGVGYKF